jgi:hypothetical protein
MKARRIIVAEAIAVALGLIGMAIGAILDPRAAAAAWLFSVFLMLGLSAGAISLLLIGKLTGGVWVETLAPVLAPLARAVPIVGIAFVPLLFFLPELYPWAAGGAHNPAVGAFYLNWPLVILRLAVAFAGWTLIAWLALPLAGATGQVAAGGALVFHVVMTTFLAYDWVLALQPAFTSSSFGGLTAILFLLSALALAALLTPLPTGKASKDVAGFLIAGILASVYVGFMQYLIIWYGDLSDTAQFYLDRTGIAPTTTLLAALVIGALLPLAMLMSEEGRKSPEIVRGASFFVLIGILLHWSWCVFGLFHPAAVAIAPAALLAVIVGFALAAGFDRQRLRGEAGDR